MNTYNSGVFLEHRLRINAIDRVVLEMFDEVFETTDEESGVGIAANSFPILTIGYHSPYNEVNVTIAQSEAKSAKSRKPESEMKYYESRE